MGTDNSSVRNYILHVWIIYEMLMHPFPYPLFAPAGKSFIDAVPVTIALRKQSPWSAAASHPVYGLNKESAALFLTNINIRARAKELKYFPPLFIG